MGQTGDVPGKSWGSQVTGRAVTSAGRLIRMTGVDGAGAG